MSAHPYFGRSLHSCGLEDRTVGRNARVRPHMDLVGLVPTRKRPLLSAPDGHLARKAWYAMPLAAQEWSEGRSGSQSLAQLGAQVEGLREVRQRACTLAAKKAGQDWVNHVCSSRRRSQQNRCQNHYVSNLAHACRRAIDCQSTLSSDCFQHEAFRVFPFSFHQVVVLARAESCHHQQSYCRLPTV